MTQKTYELGVESPLLGPDNRIKSTGSLMRHENPQGYIELGVDNNNKACLKTNKDKFAFDKALYAPEVSSSNHTRIDHVGVFDNNQRVYSANNKPSPSSLGCIAKSDNIGHGGGINADLLDGKHASDFSLNHHAHASLSGIKALSTDANKLSKNGQFGYFYGFTKETPNLSIGAVNNANAIVDISTNLRYGHQISFMSDGNLYHRTQYNSGFSTWSEIWTNRKLNEDLTFTQKVTAKGSIRSDTHFFCNNLSGEGGLVGNYRADLRTAQIIWAMGLEHTTHKTHYGIGYHYGTEIAGGWTNQIVLKEHGVIHTHLSLNGWAWFKNHIYTKSATGVSKSRVLTHADFQRETRTRIYHNAAGNGDSNIILSQPYTDFDELIVVYANDHKSSIATTRVDVAAVQEHLALKVSTAFSLVDGGLCWRVKPSANKKTLVAYDENCLIWTIYGIKKNKLIANN